MIPGDKGKHYSCSHEFRPIICPLYKHRQNKQTFSNIFKIHVFEADINNNSIRINKFSWNKEE